VITPNAVFKYIRAEKEPPNIEDSGPGDHVGHENLAFYWDLLSESEQKLLNKLAETQA